MDNLLEKFNTTTITLKNFSWIIGLIVGGSFFYFSMTDHVKDEHVHTSETERSEQKVIQNMNERYVDELKAKISYLENELKHQQNRCTKRNNRHNKILDKIVKLELNHD